jgi:hypothetical protein
MISNGLYDIACAVGILFVPNAWIFSELARLHPCIFSAEEDASNPLVQRVLAYWLMTYGSIRLVGGIAPSYTLKWLVIMTYLVEAFAFGFEYVFYQNTQWYKVLWICTSCIILSCSIHLSRPRPRKRKSSTTTTLASLTDWALEAC